MWSVQQATNMSFDLHPKREDTKEFTIGSFSWIWMLNAGVGLPLGIGKGIEPGSFIYHDKHSRIYYNDHAEITEEESLQMATAAEWVVHYQNNIYELWKQKTETERQQIQNNRSIPYNIPVRRDFVEKTRKFAEWAKRSGGFTIN